MAKIKPEVSQKLKDAIQTIESILDELPSQAKAAVGLLKSLMSKAGKAKEDVDADDIARMIEQLEVIQEALDGNDNVLELRTTICEVLESFSSMFREASPPTEHTCVCPKCGKEITVPAGQRCNVTPCPDCQTTMRQKDTTVKPKSLAAAKAPARVARLHSTAKLIEAVAGADGKAWEAVLIEAGMSANRRFYPNEVLKKSYHLFEGVKAYIDHRIENGMPVTNRSVRDIAGWFEDVACDNGAITARFVVSEGQEWLKAMLKSAYESGKEDLIGFSILAEGKTRLDREDSGAFWFVESIDKVYSVDVVTEPAAGGRLAGLAESEQKEVKQLKELAEMTKEELKAIRPDLFEEEYKVSPDVASKIKNAISELDSIKDELPAIASVVDKLSKFIESGSDIAEDEARIFLEAELSDKVVNKIKTALRALYSVKKDLPKNLVSLLDKLANSIYGTTGKSAEGITAVAESKLLSEIKRRLDIADCRILLRESLDEAKLPEPVTEKIRNRFENKIFEPEELRTAITEEKETLGKLAEMPDSPFIAKVRNMQSGSDKIVKALTGMLIGEMVGDVPPFRSLKEAYSVATGVPILDISYERLLSEARGYSSEGRNLLSESIQTSSWSEILGDSITRAMMREYKLPALEDWRKVCSEIGSIKDFRTQERIQLGGYGVLPTVGQGAAYQQLTSPSDDKVTWAVSKRGGLEDLTMETIVNDDLGAVRRIPRNLARAAKVTLYRFVFDLIKDITWATSANGNGIQKGVVNAFTDALSDAALTTAKQMMRDQTAYGDSVAFLQLKPKYMLVPNELEATALKLQTGEYALRITSLPGGSEYVSHPTEINIHRNTFETIVVDYWTDSGLWYLVADPTLSNTVEIGFLNGKQEPELLTQDQPNVGSVFTADKISYKIRHIYGGVVLDYRSFIRGGS